MCLMKAPNFKHHLALLILIFFHYVGSWLMEAFPAFITSPIQLKKEKSHYINRWLMKQL
jgi:hypothetical protein